MSWWSLLHHWEFPPTIVGACTVLLLAYFGLRRCKIDLKALSFFSGILLIFLALCSPLDVLADDYLFSAHMVQHMMLGTFAPPLLVAGLPASFVQFLLRFKPLAFLEKLLSTPALALCLGCGTFWIWHLPYLYNLALKNESVHLVEHILFMISGTILWWPVLKPIPEGKLAPMPALGYLALASFLGMVMGIMFFISDTVFYSFYNDIEDELGILSLIRNDWGLTALDDQKLGGGIMWEPMGLIFLGVMMGGMVNWYKRSEPEHEGRIENVGEK